MKILDKYPAPWVAQSSLRCGDRIVDANGAYIFDIDKPQPFPFPDDAVKLVVAAPELLAILKDALALICQECGEREHVEAPARALISRIEGGK